MLRITIALGVAALVCAIAAASASADFIITEGGKLEGHQIAGEAGEQTISPEATHEITCKKDTVNGSALVLEPEILLEKVTYGECKLAKALTAEVSEAEYEINAEGDLQPLDTITIKVTGLITCTVTLKPREVEIEGITYSPSEKLSTKLEVKLKLFKITTEVSGGGGSCGKEGTDTAGTYNGTDEIDVPSAEMKTQPPVRHHVGDCVRVAPRQGNFKDSGCTTAEVKGDFTLVQCREFTGFHMGSFSNNACTTRARGRWFLSVCMELLPATHEYEDNVCTMKNSGHGAWELFRL